MENWPLTRFEHTCPALRRQRSHVRIVSGAPIFYSDFNRVRRGISLLPLAGTVLQPYCNHGIKNGRMARCSASAEFDPPEICYLEPKKASTLDVDRGRINRHIVPLRSMRLIRDLTKADISRFTRGVMTGKTFAIEKTEKKRGKAFTKAVPEQP